MLKDANGVEQTVFVEWGQTLFEHSDFFTLTEKLLSEYLYRLIRLASRSSDTTLSLSLEDILLERQTLSSIIPTLDIALPQFTKIVKTAFEEKEHYDQCNSRIRLFFRDLPPASYLLPVKPVALCSPSPSEIPLSGIVEAARWLATITKLQSFEKLLLNQLQSSFRFEKFRPLQFEVCLAAHMQLNLIAVFPTGYGKTICFALPALLNLLSPQNYLLKVTVIISPLISLITDQLKQFEKYNLSAVALSAHNYSKFDENLMDDILEGNYNFIFVTPEKFVLSGLLSKLLGSLYAEEMLGRFVIDEAHCISLLGPEFRPHYFQISAIFELYPKVPITALTATCNEEILQDIYQVMARPYSLHFRVSMNRSNITLVVGRESSFCLSFHSRFSKPSFFSHAEPKSIEEIIKYLRSNPDSSGILYCLSRDQCHKTAAFLYSENINTYVIYHAGLTHETRRHNYSSWLGGVKKVVIATSAFGLGIHKPDVRFVFVLGLPPSIFDYAQQLGRAGRDNEPALCKLMFAFSDRFRWYFIWSTSPNYSSQSAKFESKKQQMWCMIFYAMNFVRCRRVSLLNHFNELFNPINCSHVIAGWSHGCDNCSKKKCDYHSVDVNIIGKKVIDICLFWNSKNIRTGRTFDIMVSVLLGSTKKTYRAQNESCPWFGVLAKSRWNRKLVEMLLAFFMCKGIICEEAHLNPRTKLHKVSFITVGPQQWKLESSHFSRLFLSLPKNVKVPKK